MMDTVESPSTSRSHSASLAIYAGGATSFVVFMVGISTDEWWIAVSSGAALMFCLLVEMTRDHPRGLVAGIREAWVEFRTVVWVVAFMGASWVLGWFLVATAFMTSRGTGSLELVVSVALGAAVCTTTFVAVGLVGPTDRKLWRTLFSLGCLAAATLVSSVAFVERVSVGSLVLIVLVASGAAKAVFVGVELVGLPGWNKRGGRFFSYACLITAAWVALLGFDSWRHRCENQRVLEVRGSFVPAISKLEEEKRSSGQYPANDGLTLDESSIPMDRVGGALVGSDPAILYFGSPDAFEIQFYVKGTGELRGWNCYSSESDDWFLRGSNQLPEKPEWADW